MKNVKVKLLKDLEIGKKNDEIEVSFERANYLIKVGGAVEWKQTMTEVQPFDKANESNTSIKQPVEWKQTGTEVQPFDKANESDTSIKQPAKKVNDGKGNPNRGAKRRKKAATSRKS